MTKKENGPLAGRRGETPRLLCSTAIALALGFAPQPVAAQGAEGQATEQRQLVQAQQREFNIPAQPLTSALTAFGDQAGMQVTVDTAILAGRTSQPVSGSMAPEEALRRLLAGSGITWRFADSTTLVLSRPGSGDGALTLDPVRVEGVARYAGQTEGTGSYTTDAVTIGKTPTSLRETPQSVSVTTRQRMNDQNFTDIGDALRYVAGITLQPAFSVYGDIRASARGYDVELQSDGLRQQPVGSDAYQQFDLAIYDRIEVLRGPAGLFSGGNFSGAKVNLVRKRALEDAHLGGAAGAGSWGTKRGEADITGPLLESGKIRGRLVGVAEKRGDWRDSIDNDKQLIYGTLELDLTDRTTLSVGGARQHADTDNFEGLPAFADGRLLDVPRSTSFATDWTGNRLENADVFLELEHRLKTGGLVKALLRRTETSSDFKFVGSVSSVAPDGSVQLRSRANEFENTATAADTFVSTPFDFGGQTHNFLIGADYSKQESNRQISNATVFPLATVNIFSFDASAIPEPTYAAPFFDNLSKTTSYGLYSQLRLKPIEALTLIGGARLS